MSRAREAARLANQQILTVSTGNDKVGIGSVIPVTKLDVEGNITADDAFLKDVNVVSVGVTNLSVSGVSTLTGNVSFGGTANFGDHDQIRMGDGADLKLYHDGANGYLTNGSGAFHIRNRELRLQNPAGENYFLGNTNGSVELYYDNSKKFETTGYGVTITGGMYASGISTSGSTFNIKPTSNVNK